jgi:hypothetical protein
VADTVTRKCSNCRWAAKITGDPAHRECRVDPPQAFVSGGAPVVAYWSVVDKGAWCRSWNLETPDWP